MLQKYITVDGLKDFFCPLKHLWLIDNECTAVFHRDRRTFNYSVISAISGIYLTELELCLRIRSLTFVVLIFREFRLFFWSKDKRVFNSHLPEVFMKTAHM